MRVQRILHVSTDAQRIGGAERLLVDLAARSGRGHEELSFVFLSGPGVVSESIERLGFECVCLDVLARGWRRASACYRESVSRFRPSVIHSHLYHAGVVAALLSGGARGTLVHSRHHHCDAMSGSGRVRAIIDRWMVRRHRLIFAVSESVRDDLIAHRFPAHSILIANNGVDTEFLGTLSRRRGREELSALGVDVDQSVVICVANFLPEKGHIGLLDSWCSVAERVPKAQLVLVGGGPLLKRCLRVVSERGLGEQVHLVGSRSNAPELVAGADIYVQPSLSEGFGLAVGEAMAVAKPCVVFAVGGLRLLVEDFTTGRTIPLGNYPAFADAVVELIYDADQRRRFGEAGRRRVQNHFSIERTVSAYESGYTKAVGGDRIG